MTSHLTKLADFSAKLEELFVGVLICGGPALLPQELADEIAATAGEIMVELADYRDDVARGAVNDARRLREVVRTIGPEAARAAEAGRALVCDLQLVIREDKRAA